MVWLDPTVGAMVWLDPAVGAMDEGDLAVATKEGLVVKKT